MFKKVSLVFIVIICSIVLASCMLPRVPFTSEYISKLSQSEFLEEEELASGEEVFEKTISSTIDLPLQYICDKMKLLKKHIVFSLDGTNADTIDTIMKYAALQLDLPDIAYRCDYREEADKLIVDLMPNYSDAFVVQMSAANPELKKQTSDSARELYSKALSIIGKLQIAAATDTEKALKIHDFLIENVLYPPDDLLKDPKNSDIHTARGALVDGIAVCDGYAEAYQLLLSIVGIRSIPIVGLADGEKHEWNLVLIHGKWYHVDVTWDDSDEREDEQSPSNYGFFLINDDWISHNHTWDKSAYPLAEDLTLNPYYATGRVVHSYKEFSHLMLQSIVNGEKDIAMYILSYHANEYPTTFLSIVPGQYYYQEPEEGENGVYRLYIKEE